MTTPDKPEAQVVSKDAGGRTRVHFSGLLRDAKSYVEHNFPRVHVEPGSNVQPAADVHLVTADGDHVAYHGENSGGVNGWHNVNEDGSVVENETTSDPTQEQ